MILDIEGILPMENFRDPNSQLDAPGGNWSLDQTSVNAFSRRDRVERFGANVRISFMFTTEVLRLSPAEGLLRGCNASSEGAHVFCILTINGSIFGDGNTDP